MSPRTGESIKGTILGSVRNHMLVSDRQGVKEDCRTFRSKFNKFLLALK